MEDLLICRVCLAMDTKMCDLLPLYPYLELVVGNNPLSTADLPPYVCLECAVLLRKYYKFYEKCLLGQSVLYGLLHNSGKITAEEIKQLNREELNLSSQLTTHHIREEAIISLNDEKSRFTVKFEPPDEIQDGGILEDLVKIEDDDFHIGFSSDDDEPLVLKKKKKTKDKEKKKGKRERKKKEVVNNLLEQETETEHIDLQPAPVELEPIETIESLKTTKRKRGRPRKIETDIASQSKIKKDKKRTRRTSNTGGVEEDDGLDNLEEYVTIIKLSVEEQIEEINKRKESSNYLNSPFQCNLCYKGFVDTHAWKHHIGKHDPSAGDVECGICKFRYMSKRILLKHAANHEKKYACKACPYVSKTTTQAKQHQRWHKGVTYQCQYCEEVSTKWTSYLSHVRMKHPSTHVCGACGYSFVSALGLAMHRTMMHKDLLDKADSSDVEGPHCADCGVKFVSEEAYKRHMVTSLTHMRSKNYNTGCRVCGEVFNSSEELRVHHRKEHAKKRPKNYGRKPTHTTWPAPCEHCAAIIPNAREYWVHFRRAHPDKSYPIKKDHVCDMCGKSFRGNAFLVYHKRTHFEERAFKCAQCPKAFFNRTNLQMHEKTHSDFRPYPCDMCNKAFKGKGALDRHYRSHTGQKPYECEVCGKAFGQSNSRKLHVRTVHLKQPAPYVSRARLERRQAAAVTPWTL